LSHFWRQRLALYEVNSETSTHLAEVNNTPSFSGHCVLQDLVQVPAGKPSFSFKQRPLLISEARTVNFFAWTGMEKYGILL